MSEQDEERTTVNVKSVSLRSWEAARKAAGRHGEPMGVWLSRAIDQLVKLEAGERYILPDERPIPSASRTVLPPVDFREIAAILMAMKEAGLPVQKRVGHHVNALLHTKLREARGEGVIPALPTHENGKAMDQIVDGRDRDFPQLETTIPA